jgi:restriction endonuclease Mrr
MHCSNSYFKKRNLQRHILSAHKHLVQTWLCDECPREYLSQRSLISHKLQTHPSTAEMVRKNAEAAAAAEMVQQLPQDENEQEPRVVVEMLPQPDANVLPPMEFKDLFVL